MFYENHILLYAYLNSSTLLNVHTMSCNTSPKTWSEIICPPPPPQPPNKTINLEICSLRGYMTSNFPSSFEINKLRTVTLLCSQEELYTLVATLSSIFQPLPKSIPHFPAGPAVQAVWYSLLRREIFHLQMQYVSVAGSGDGETGRPIVSVSGAGTATEHSSAAVRISGPL